MVKSYKYTYVCIYNIMTFIHLTIFNTRLICYHLSEGWHNRFQVVVGRQHPSVYSFFNELGKEQADTE